MTLVGGAIGLGASIWLGNLAASLLYELKGHDIVVLVTAAIVLSAWRSERASCPRAARPGSSHARAPLRVATASSSLAGRPTGRPALLPHLLFDESKTKLNEGCGRTIG